MTLIDTAEMYAEGGAEEVVGEAIKGRRDEVFLVSKVYPHNASRAGTVAACERSLKRLGTDRIDLYLLHWRGSIRWRRPSPHSRRCRRPARSATGASAISTSADMEELLACRAGADAATNQVLYNLKPSRHRIRSAALGRRAQGMPVMAYSPIEQGRLRAASGAAPRSPSATAPRPAQIALAWVLRRPDVIAIPKAGSARACPREPRRRRYRAHGRGSRRARRRLPAAAPQAVAGDDLGSGRAESGAPPYRRRRRRRILLSGVIPGSSREGCTGASGTLLSVLWPWIRFGRMTAVRGDASHFARPWRHPPPRDRI